MHAELLQPANLFLALVVVASITAVVVRFIRVPYTVALVVAGLLVSSLTGLKAAMTPDLVLIVFLPALLFEAAWNIDLAAFRKDWLPITLMATAGVVASVLLTGSVLYFFGGFDVRLAMVFAAMISATDPVSVVSMFRKLGVSKRLTMLMEGESLLNDGTAVVAFKLASSMALAGAAFSFETTLHNFAFNVLGGLALGAAAGLVFSMITRLFDDHFLEITFTVISAYGAFLFGEQIHVSPVIAAVTAAVIMGNYGKRYGMSPTTRLAVHSFWENAAFLVNSVLFILIGATINLGELLADWKLILVAIAAVFAARFVVVLLTPARDKIPWQWKLILFWGGLRGALSMALALSLPVDFPARNEILHMTFAVVLFSLLAQGLTIEPLVKALKISVVDEQERRYRTLRARLMTLFATIENLDSFRRLHQISHETHEKLKANIKLEIDSVEADLAKLKEEHPHVLAFEINETERELAIMQKDHLRHLAHADLLDEGQLAELTASLDARLERQD
ncbi:MAG: Na+/H+ antiporter [Cyanobacteria bacterium HKST-UBA02]|nr:Na+/H+ antiporter [Cyanobacteria bacterium HKST-UBA02]